VKLACNDCLTGASLWQSDDSAARCS